MDLGKLSAMAHHRECRICGAEFDTKIENGLTIPALEQFADHMAEHNPTPKQWANAYEIIQRTKPRAS